MVSVCLARRCTSPLGVVPVGLGDGVGDCHDVANFLKKCLCIPLSNALQDHVFSLFWTFLSGKQKNFFFFLSYSVDVIPSRARSVCHHLRRAGRHSVWSPACQDQVAGGHPGVGVVSLGGPPVSLPSFVTHLFKEFFSIGRIFEKHSSYWERRSGTFICRLRVQGAEQDAGQLLLTDKLPHAVLAEAQVGLFWSASADCW